MTTVNLKARHLKAMDKVGDIYCPAYKGLPSFSALGCSEYMHLLVEKLPAQDAKDLKLLLSLISFMPIFLVKLLVRLTESFRKSPGFLGDNLRKMRFGLMGLSYSLYYSGMYGEEFQGDGPIEIIENTSRDPGKSPPH